MNVKTEKVTLPKSQQETFEYLSEMKNYEALMPEDTKTFEVHESGEGFSVQIGSLPKVGMKLKEKSAPDTIIFESPSANFDYMLTINIAGIDDSTSEVDLDFEGKFNMMIEMMAKKPLTNFIETISDNLAKL